MWKIALIVSFIVGLLLGAKIYLTSLYEKGYADCVADESIKRLEIQKIEKNEIIQENLEVHQRKAANKSIATNDNIEWMLSNFCPDCQGV